MINLVAVCVGWIGVGEGGKINGVRLTRQRLKRL